MRLTRRGHFDWFDLIILALVAAIVYPDKILDWLTDKTGRDFGWRHLLIVELIAIGLLVLTMYFLMPSYSKLVWWYPVGFIAGLAAIRLIVWILLRLFGFED